MPAPKNHLKAALAAKTVQHGIWMNLVSPIAAEALAGCGFDWLLIDGEHGPNDIPTILAQVQAMGNRTSVVVRPPVGEVRLVKQLLDLGVQTLLIPMIESADHARQITDYITTANAETCLILQVESRAGLAALPEILKLDGVDGVFIGPADLAADMGYPGNMNAPEVQETIDATLKAIMASGKSAGILTFDPKIAQRYQAMGVTFLGVGSDVAILTKAATALASGVKAG